MANQFTSVWSRNYKEKLAKLFKLRNENYNFDEISAIMRETYKEPFTASNCSAKYYRTNPDVIAEDSQTPQEKPFEEKIKHKQNGEIEHDKLVQLTEEEAKSPDRVMELCGYDPKQWKVVKCDVVFWTYRDKETPDGKVSRRCKLIVEPLQYELDYNEIKEDIKELMANYTPPIFKPTRYEKNGKLLEVNISDLHINKLGYIDGEYDHDQAERIFFHILHDILTRTSEYKFEKIFFIWSHDFCNIDNLAKTTTGGTPQDVSQRYADMYKQAKRMLIKGIDLLRQVAPVETIQVGANHDNLTSYTLAEVLESFFHNDDDVLIDTDPLRRKYRKFGKALIGFSHGEKEKKRLGKIMPVEARKEWGETIFTEIHAAHLHSEQAVVEENGTIIRYLSSPSGTDNWHYESGYVGAIKKVQHFIWDKELGLTDIKHTTITKQSLSHL